MGGEKLLSMFLQSQIKVPFMFKQYPSVNLKTTLLMYKQVTLYKQMVVHIPVFYFYTNNASFGISQSEKIFEPDFETILREILGFS